MEAVYYSQIAHIPNPLNSCISKYIYIDDLNTLYNYFDNLKILIDNKCCYLISSNDFDSLKFIENNIDCKTNIYLSLIDDCKNKDRSYIDFNEFKKTELEIPLSYMMWGPKEKEKMKISHFFDDEKKVPYDEMYYQEISKTELNNLKKLIYDICYRFKDYDDVDKIILVSNYIQNRMQYVLKKVKCNNGVYVIDENLSINNYMVANLYNALDKGYGICSSISSLSMLMLNNKILNVNSRLEGSENHLWNIDKVGDKFYYTDNTFCITRNRHLYSNSLKAKKFSSDFLLFGLDSSKFSHNAISFSNPVSIDDYDDNVIKNRVNKLSKNFSFDNYEKPHIKTKLLKRFDNI